MKIKLEHVVTGILFVTSCVALKVTEKRLDDAEIEISEARLENTHLKTEIDILRNDCASLMLYNRLKVGSIQTFSDDESWNKWAEHYCEHIDNIHYFQH